MKNRTALSIPARANRCLLAALLACCALASHAQTRSSLAVGESLVQGSVELRSPSGEFRFQLIPGNGLALDSGAGAKQLWKFTTPELMLNVGKPPTRPPHRLTLEPKGSLVLWAVDGKSIVWSSQSDYPDVKSLALQDDGDLVIFDGRGQKIWSLRDPVTKRYRNDDNGVFLKYSGSGPDPSRYANNQVDLDDLDKGK